MANDGVFNVESGDLEIFFWFVKMIKKFKKKQFEELSLNKGIRPEARDLNSKVSPIIKSSFELFSKMILFKTDFLTP